MQIRFTSIHLPFHWNVVSKEMKYGLSSFPDWKLGLAKQHQVFEAVVNTLYQWWNFFKQLNQHRGDPGSCGWLKLLNAFPSFFLPWRQILSDSCAVIFYHYIGCAPPRHLPSSLLCCFLRVWFISPPLLLSSWTYSPRVYFPFGIYFIPSMGVLILCHIDHLLPGVPSSLSHRLLLHVGHFWLFQCWLRFSQLMP